MKEDKNAANAHKKTTTRENTFFFISECSKSPAAARPGVVSSRNVK